MKKFALVCVFAFVCEMAGRGAAAETLYLADQNAQPGVVLAAEGNHQVGEIHRRGPRAHLDHVGAVGKIQSVAAARDGAVFFASGLDGYIFELRSRRETLAYTHRGQVRDLAMSPSGETLFFSVVATPENGGPPSDGQIFELDLRSGNAGLYTNVRQAEVEQGWWGAFTMEGGKLFLGTIGKPSRIYEVIEDTPRAIFETYDLPILGLAVSNHGDLFYAGGTDKVFVVRDGHEPAVAIQSIGRKLSDVSLPPTVRRHTLARPPVTLPIEPAAPPTDDDLGRVFGKLRAEAEDRWGTALLFGPDDRERLFAIVKIAPSGDFRFDGLPAGRYWALLGRADLDLSHVLRPAVIELDSSAGSTESIEFRLETR